MTAVAKDQVQIIQGGDLLSSYQWGTKVAEHYFCSRCGIYTHHRRRVNPNQFGLNVAALAGINPRDLGDVPWPEQSNR